MEFYPALVKSEYGNAWIACCGEQKEVEEIVCHNSEVTTEIDIVIRNNIIFCIGVSRNVN